MEKPTYTDVLNLANKVLNLIRDEVPEYSVGMVLLTALHQIEVEEVLKQGPTLRKE